MLCELTFGEKVRTRATGMRTSPPATLTPRLGRRPALPGCPERPTDLRGPIGRLRRRVRRSQPEAIEQLKRLAQARFRSPSPQCGRSVAHRSPPLPTAAQRSCAHAVFF